MTITRALKRRILFKLKMESDWEPNCQRPAIRQSPRSEERLTLDMENNLADSDTQATSHIHSGSPPPKKNFYSITVL